MKINCVSCGFNMMLDDAYDDFEGLFKCYVCDALLHVKICDGKIKAVNLASVQRQPPLKNARVDKRAVG